MTDTAASLQRKIDSASDLQSVVRTMKAVAGASVGQYERSVAALGDYYRTVELGLGACFRERALLPTMPRPKPRAASASGAIVFGSDQGLVGQFNELIADYAIATLAKTAGTPRVWAVGERVHARLADAGLPLIGLSLVPNSVEAIAPLVAQIQIEMEAQLTAAGAEVVLVFYNRQRIGAPVEPVSQRMLPLDATWERGLVDSPWPTVSLPEVIGGGTYTLRALVREYLFISLFRACAESLASENASRLAAMERADRNIDELLGNLHGTFRRLRQTMIDEELFDVISGYEALSKRH